MMTSTSIQQPQMVSVTELRRHIPTKVLQSVCQVSDPTSCILRKPTTAVSHQVPQYVRTFIHMTYVSTKPTASILWCTKYYTHLFAVENYTQQQKSMSTTTTQCVLNLNIIFPRNLHSSQNTNNPTLVSLDSSSQKYISLFQPDRFFITTLQKDSHNYDIDQQ